MMYLQTTALLALASTVSAHLRITTPVPFDWEDSGKRQNPLTPADFPCKQPSGKYAYTTLNKYKAGDSMSVQITGGATHGGGSCQFSITTDTKPTKETQWKVLFSQIGGCPGGPGNDNLDITSPNAADNNSLPPFKVPLPKDLPSGKYTFAWTWNNRLGNREFYMNCAPIEVTGGSGDVSKVLGGLPDMFTINLPETQCELAAEQDALYPNPGKAVATGAGAKPGLKMSGAGCGAQTKLGAGAGKLGSPGAGGAPAATGAPESGSGSAPKPTTMKSSAAPKPTGNGPVLAPGASSAAAAPATPEPTGSTGGSTGGSAPSTGSSPAGCTACSSDGAVVCIGSTSFGICDRGCAIAQPLAAGMTCSNGKIARRSVFGSWFN